MKLTRFEDLDCWQQARHLTRIVYEATKDSTFAKDLRLSGQIQAAATSVMANIAEGFIRRSDKEFIQFLFIAMSSAAEVQSHLYVALDQGYIEDDHFQEIYDQADKTAMIISGLIKYLRTHPTNLTKPTKQTKSTKQTRPTKSTR
jgi:four helix bundle protein